MRKTLEPVSTAHINLIIPLSVLFLGSFLGHRHTCHAQATTTFIYADCSPHKFQPNSPFEATLNTFLSSAVSAASGTSYAAFSTGNEAPAEAPEEAALYGLHQCRGDLEAQDCGRCVQSAASQIGGVCAFSYGAGLQLEGCYVRYEHVDFLGRPDERLVHRECSRVRAAGNDGDAGVFLQGRDAVLGDLPAVDQTGWRLSRSGSVQGFAQCLEDLSPADCTHCVTEGAEKLKSMCGLAAAGDVFLVQCYARYWSSGNTVDSSSRSGSSNEDDVGKTVALIIATIAGIAVLIVFLSICRKAVS